MPGPGLEPVRAPPPAGTNTGQAPVTDQNDIADLIRLIAADPDAAETALAAQSGLERDLITVAACQSAIGALYLSPPTPAEVRALIRTVRRIWREPIHSRAVAALIDSRMRPDSTAAQRRLDALDPAARARTELLLPHAVITHVGADAATIDQWVANTVDFYTANARRFTEQYGPDGGEFYRTVCLDPTEAARIIDDTDLTGETAMLMMLVAGTEALGRRFGNRTPTGDERTALAEQVRHRHGVDITTALDDLVASWRNPNHAIASSTADLCEAALLLPSTIFADPDTSAVDIVAFMRDCRTAEYRYRNS